MTKPNSHSTDKPKFWNQKYLDGTIGWDIGEPTPAFVNWSKTISKNNKILIPGCGNGHDAIYLSKSNQNVYALDFAMQPIIHIQNISKKQNLDITNFKNHIKILKIKKFH